MGSAAPDVPVRDAATLILVRDPANAPAVLMGTRGADAVFLPSRRVFPGGATDAGDAALPLPPFAATAIRELWEETGLILGRPGAFAPPPGWTAFAATGHRPDADGLLPVFRAITPPGRPRRYDARFFLADAARIAGGPDAPLGGDGELSDLAWVPLDAAAAQPLPFVTAVALAEARARLPDLATGRRRAVPVMDGTARTVRRP